jgi:acyl-CoA synthetase (AMP-forming)/AMP-acid ligase II
MGIKEGGCVALYCPNHVDYLGCVLAAASLTGSMVTPINLLYTARELSVVLDRNNSSVLLAHISKLDVALEAAKGLDHVKHIIALTHDGEVLPEGVVDLSSLRHHHRAFYKTIQDVHDKTP